MTNEKGLTAYQIKVIAAFLMVLDHIHYYFSYTNSVPIAFNWLGRIVAPIFIYFAVEGFYYTSNLKRYMLRLYIGHILMSIGNNAISLLLPRPDGVILSHSMFGTLFLVLYHLHIFDIIKHNIKHRNKKKTFLAIIALLLPTFLSFLVMLSFTSLPINLIQAIITIFPNIFLVEYSILGIILGLLFYIKFDDKLGQIFSLLFITSFTLIGAKFNAHYLFFENYQWMMAFASIFIYLYNGYKGENSKYSFYLFYPLHAYILYIISVLAYK